MYVRYDSTPIRIEYADAVSNSVFGLAIMVSMYRIG